ncbi:MAG: PIN domain-containing protein [Planctomycetaceae bacterium]|nr:PIN domain-containing protein [Planctomycetaceae bacterium]
MNAIDTNVLIYAVDSADPVRQSQAINLLNTLANDPDKVVLLWQVAVEYLACLRRWENLGRIVRDDTTALVDAMEATFECVFPTATILKQSLTLSSHYSLSHWDSLLVAACIEAGVTTLYSEDLASGMRYETVSVINPFAV